MKRTVLFDEHKKLGATTGEFGGWEMPLWYKTGQIKEHLATREACGLFDICHMGEFIITGKDSFDFWNKVLSNAISKIVDGQAQYNFMLNENGGVIDDCILYRFSEEKWMLVVNAGTQDEDFEWLQKQAKNFKDVKLENISEKTGKLDLQGPKAPKIIAKIAGKEAVEGMKFFRFRENINLDGVNVILSRTGYTGEIGFEIYCDINDVEKLWNILMKNGEEFGITPAGLGARDTLRLEAGLPLHEDEIRVDIPAVGTPWEFAINYDHDFIGKEALLKHKGTLFVYPIVFEGKRKPGKPSKVMFNNEVVGELTSEILAVSFERKPVGFIRTTKEFAEGDVVELINKKEKTFKATIVKNPIVKGTSRKKMALFI